MGADFFAASDALIKRTGSSDPMEVIERNNIVYSDLTGSIVGMASKYQSLYTLGVNCRLNYVMRLYALWHEIGHICLGHIDVLPTNTAHSDIYLFTQEVDSRLIPRQERDANIISAEYCVSTDSVLDMIAYNSKAMQDYRKLKATQKQLNEDYKRFCSSVNAEHRIPNMMKYRLVEYQKGLKNMEERKQYLEAEIAEMGCCLSCREMADQLGTSETIVKYKLEALRIRGYDIDTLELERYDRVFRDVL